LGVIGRFTSQRDFTPRRESTLISYPINLTASTAAGWLKPETSYETSFIQG
jgi:hypothetical protein